MQSSEPGTDHAGAAADLFALNPGGSNAEDESEERTDGEEDGRSATSKARDGMGDMGDDDQSLSSLADRDGSMYSVSIVISSPQRLM